MPRRHRSAPPAGSELPAIDPALTTLRPLWTLRALLRAGGLRRFLQRAEYGLSNHHEAVLALLELDSDDEHTPIGWRSLLRRTLKELETTPPDLQDSPLYRNTVLLCQQFGLSAAEQEVLLFCVALHVNDTLATAMECLGDLSSAGLIQALAQILALPSAAVSAALHPRGLLAATGLAKLDLGGSHELRHKLDVLHGLPDVLQCEALSADDLLASYVHQPAPALLTLADYAHLADLDLLQRILETAVRAQRVGVNVLLYGPPGTGKTQLARTLAAALGCVLYEVSVEDSDGDPLSGERRLSAYRLGQHLLRQRPDCLLLFDEIEDVFPDEVLPFFGRVHSQERHKGFFNRLLENNVTPALWLSNHIEQIDPAFLRRFDFVMEVPTPPRPVRESLLRTQLAELAVTPAWLARQAALEHLTPALIDRAVRVTRQLSPPDARSTEHCLERLLANSLRAMNLPAAPTPRDRLQPDYDLTLVNADVDLAQLATGLAACGQGRICLYGPPGTGKSAYARHLAERLGRPLLQQRASDILGRYVSETEENLARLFARARRDNAVLLLDEADSFLRERRTAHASWEVTQVNELLVQMEDYDGVFVCATNLFDSLDSAVLRRFDLKVRLNYLTPAAVWQLFQHCLARCGVTPDASTAAVCRSEMLTLDRLTPGDFATVLRRARVLGVGLDPHSLLRALVQEQQLKPGASRPIGFVASAPV